MYHLNTDRVSTGLGVRIGIKTHGVKLYSASALTDNRFACGTPSLIGASISTNLALDCSQCPRVSGVDFWNALFRCEEDRQMHDFTLVLAFVAVVLLAYHGEIDDRPDVQDDEWLHIDPAD